MDLNEWGQLSYSQKHQEPTSGLLYESFYIGGSQPMITRLAQGNPQNLGSYFIVNAGINDNGRWVVVRAEPTRDNDGDGILDYDELGARNHGSGNEDGVPDSVQPHLAAVPSLVNNWNVVTFTTDQNCTLTNAQAVPNPSLGDALNDPFPFGHFAFELTDVSPGGAATVEVTLPCAAVQSWWKYGPTPNNTSPHWYDFVFDGTTGAEINGNVVTLHLVDLMRGASDLTANGIIVDPGGPGSPLLSFYLLCCDELERALSIFSSLI